PAQRRSTRRHRRPREAGAALPAGPRVEATPRSPLRQHPALPADVRRTPRGRPGMTANALRGRALPFLALLLLAGPGCRLPRSTAIAPPKGPAASAIRFEDVTAAAGIRFTHFTGA